MSYTTRQWVLKEQTEDNLDVNSAFNLITREISVSDLEDGDILVKNIYLSNDPAQRTWIHKTNVEGRLYRTPIKAGEPMEAFGVAEVIESKNSSYKQGERVVASLHWSEYSVLSPAAVFFKASGDGTNELTLGVTGITAYFGLLNVGAATSKDSTIVVSGAAGSTGSLVCQIAKNVLGIKNVVGIAGTDAKCKVLEQNCGCDIALNYRSPTFKRDFEAATRDDIDIYFDNVGGEITDMAVMRMKEFGRVVVCGAISFYDQMHDKSAGNAGISRASWLQVLTLFEKICHKIRIEGFVIFQFADQFLKGMTDLGTWVQEGKIKLIKQIWEADINEVPQGMLKLFNG
ncbi:hypothetical protein ABW20_dc0103519 [Dactylellina cionopaga]|nr:hypothetical protein ABW20_dc0103519 [Dactylellina cionopaga]